MTDENHQNLERETRILDAAASLVLHYGYDKTTVSDIAREARVSKGAIYLHWKSKDELFQALIWREVWRYADTWISKLEAASDGGSLFSMYKYSLAGLHTHPFMKALFTRDRRILGDFLSGQEAELIRQKFLMGKDFLRMMQGAGALREDADPEVVSYLMSGIAYGLVKVDEIVPPDEAPDFLAVIEETSEMLTRAYGTPDEASQQAGKQIIRQVIEAAKKQFSPSNHANEQ
ncbi:MAG: TetR/AcrR family transcriptional regulator [Anaerolineaceae bacterium]|nr:TetR/AcrR family transcriptional regulator [Anaerolineaceae bacterium]